MIGLPHDATGWILIACLILWGLAVAWAIVDDYRYGDQEESHRTSRTIDLARDRDRRLP